jgi:hypothetical protein
MASLHERFGATPVLLTDGDYGSFSSGADNAELAPRVDRIRHLPALQILMHKALESGRCEIPPGDQLDSGRRPQTSLPKIHSLMSRPRIDCVTKGVRALKAKEIQGSASSKVIGVGSFFKNIKRPPDPQGWFERSE